RLARPEFSDQDNFSDSSFQSGVHPLSSQEGLGWWRRSGERGGLVAGTYLHAVFENGPWRRRWLNLLRIRHDLPPLSENQPHHARQREALLDRLADAFEEHVDLNQLLSPCEN
ncbi:MAG: hypothetical protein WCH37_05410, partial [Synechococcaceae cyanobacterium ELA182]